MWVRLRLSQQTFEGLKNLKTWSDVIPKKVRKIIVSLLIDSRARDKGQN